MGTAPTIDLTRSDLYFHGNRTSNHQRLMSGWGSQMRGTLTTLRQLPTKALAEKQESLLKD